MKCFGCGSIRMRTSRLRLSDIPGLLLLRYPVRCYSCLQRDTVSLWSAWRLRSDGKARRRVAIDHSPVEHPNGSH